MITKLTNRILEVYPKLTINSVVIDETGQNNHVVIINDSLVFRFPKYEQGIKDLETEVTILKNLKGVTTLPISSPTYLSFEKHCVGKVFSGYQKIEGETLSKDSFQELSTSIQHHLAVQLVTFLKEVHTAPTESLERREADLYATFQQLFTRIQDKLFPFMRQDAQIDVKKAFESYLTQQKKPIKQTLIHGDFGASNILWKPETKDIAGIIDFGGSSIGDPAYDFAGLLSSYGQDFYQTCISLYPEGEEVAKRVKFYRSTFALQEALHGLDHKDPTAFENGIQSYK
ncbi:aminoglycoside phosphotransferase family protein [Bacillus sp. BGMRC 2118]|nr:aminoglycoside phosphotransferase family protein [Bacillus sp. BGMRC 2118]